jgi:hypothetical protein
MKRTLSRAVIAALLVVVVFGPVLAWVDPETQAPPRNVWTLWDSSGAKITSGSVRFYVRGADSTLTANQLDFVFVAAESGWTNADTMRDGSMIRDSYFDGYRISPGTDSLLVSGKLDGLRAAQASVDSTAIRDATIPESKLVGSFSDLILADSSLSARVYGFQSIDASRKLVPGSIDGFLIGSDARLLVQSIRTDSLTLGDASTMGVLLHHDGSSHTVQTLPSASMSGNASFYLPIATGSTNGVYQKTASGAQITLSPTGLTAIGASGTVSGGLGSFTRLDVPGVSAPDTSTVKNQLRVGKKLILGGWGNIGKAYFQRDGFQWGFGPSGLSGTGSTEVVYGNASTGDIATYSVGGSTETITPASPETVMDSMPIWYGIVTLPASTAYVGFRAPGATANTVVHANWEDSVTGTNITYIVVSASTDTLWATASSTKLVNRNMHISGLGK